MSRSKNFISLAEHNPELVSEWHPTLNGELTAELISYGSAKKIWWKCASDHEWQATANDRSGGRGCPQCSEIQRQITRAKNIIARRGSLADKNPKLASQWHPTLNGELKPTDVTNNSDRKVWWVCEKGHEWDATIGSRNSGNGCPVCSGHRLLVGYNDLATLRPDIASWWHPTKNGDLRPTDVKLHDFTSVWWKCPEGHEWEAKIIHRTGDAWCPICQGRRVIAGVNDLATVMPIIALEWHPTKNGDLTPRDVVAASNKKVWWMCEKGHEWQTSVSHRKSGTRCPKCFGEIKSSFPEQTIFFYLGQFTTAHNRYMVDPRTEIDIYLPEYKIGIEYDGVYFHSGEKAQQRELRKQEKLDSLGIKLIRVKESEDIENEENREFVIYSKPGPNDAELGKTVENICKKISAIIGQAIDIDVNIARDKNKIYERYILSEKENSLAVVNPTLAAEWHPTKNGTLCPENLSISANKKVWWQCEKGHEWQAMLNSRAQGIGCPYCANKKVLVGYNDLATVNPELASEWNHIKNGNLKPQDVTISSNRRVWWQCKLGHEWETVVGHRRKSNCPVCSGHKVLVGYNDLLTTNPDLANSWHPTKNGTLKPTDVTRGCDKKVWWRCEKNHEWEAVISSRSAGCGCPYCSNQRLLVGYNDLATVHPQIASEWHPTKNENTTPQDIISGSNKKYWWQCKKGHGWEAAVSSRVGGNGCPYCANQKLLVGYNDLATLYPKLASEWHPTKNGKLKPEDIVAGSNKKYWWKCELGHEWEVGVSVRMSGNNCPYCGSQKLLKGYNDLQTLNPKLAAQWHPTLNGDLTPSDFISGSNKKAWWICENKHEWYAQIGSRNKGAGCMACYRLRRKAAYQEQAKKSKKE